TARAGWATRNRSAGRWWRSPRLPLDGLERAVPGPRRPESRQDRPRRRRAVERVEVDSGCAAREQVRALERGVGDTQILDRVGVLRPRGQFTVELVRDARVAQLGEALDLREGGAR